MKPIEDLDDDDFEILDPGLSGVQSFDIVSFRRRRRRRRGGDSPALSIILSNNTTSDAAANGAQVGTFAVLGSADAWVFSFISNPGNRFSLVGPVLEVAAAPLAPGLDVIAVEADNGHGIILLQSFIIVVSHSGGAYVPTYPFLGF